MGGTEAFPGLGKHCAEPMCRQLDFLPFTCDSCKQIFCLDHRTYKDHNCPKGDVKDNTVFICPICAKTVRNVPGQDENVTMEQHQREGCDPSNYDKVMKKPKCPVRGCGQTLTFSNRVRCRNCGKDVCLRHRFVVDHRCPSLAVAAPGLKGPASSSKASESKFLEGWVRRTGQDCGVSSTSSEDTKLTTKKLADLSIAPSVRAR